LEVYKKSFKIEKLYKKQIKTLNLARNLDSILKKRNETSFKKNPACGHVRVIFNGAVPRNHTLIKVCFRIETSQ